MKTKNKDLWFGQLHRIIGSDRARRHQSSAAAAVALSPAILNLLCTFPKGYISYLSILSIYPIYLSYLSILSIYPIYLSYLSILAIYPSYLS